MTALRTLLTPSAYPRHRASATPEALLTGLWQHRRVTTSEGKPADTSVPLHPLLAERWSPRGFDRNYSLTDDELTGLLEAVRWAPSAANSQPWRLIPACRGDASFDLIHASLDDGNKVWAQNASALVVMATEVTDANGKQRRWAWYDAGQAAAHLTVQATALGLVVHQMGGFDADAVREAFALPPSIEPIAVLAVGRWNPDADLPDHLAEREHAPRVRLSVSEIVWG